MIGLSISSTSVYNSIPKSTKTEAPRTRGEMIKEARGTDFEDPITSSRIEGVHLSVSADITTNASIFCCPMPTSRHDAQPHQPCNEDVVDCLSDIFPCDNASVKEGQWIDGVEFQ